MVRSRLQLRDVLRNAMVAVGATPNTYFQPPKNTQMSYPCIVYKRDFQATEFADNVKYRHMRRWQLTIIDEDPDSLIPDMVETLQYTTFIRSYTADGLNHTIITIYF